MTEPRKSIDTVGLGKVILLGEHAVVHGHPALAAALDRGLSAHVIFVGKELRLRVPMWELLVAASDDHPVARALCAITEALGVQPRDVRALLEVEADIPAAAGLGSSAAMAVCVTRAVAAYLDRDLPADEIERVANAAEACFHHRPSGVDVALASRGGLGLYRRGSGLTSIACPRMSLAVGLSGRPRSTAAMVERVAAAVGGDPEDPRLIELGDAAVIGANHLATGTPEALGPLMTKAHHILAELGVSTGELDAMVEDALSAGALGAKLTGAGGGGAVIAFAPGREQAVVEAWRRRGKQWFVAEIGG